MRRTLTFFLLLLATFPAYSQNANTLSINLTDQNGGLITVGIVSLIDAQGKKAAEMSLARNEKISLVKISAGNYVLEIQSPGFKSYRKSVEIKNGENSIDVELEVEEINVNVEIEQTEREKRFEEAIGGFLSEREIAALPESGEEIKEELQRRYGDDILIRIDGDFEGSQIPPREQIASIKVVRSTFDAEFHQIASTIIDIRTKVGASKFGGFVHFSLNDSILNARNPFDAERRPRQRKQFIAFLSGPIIQKKTSFSFSTFGVDNSETQNYLGVISAENTAESQRKSKNRLSFSTFSIKHNLPGEHTLNFKYQLNSFSFDRLGAFDLPERGSTFSTPRHSLSVTESGTFRKKYVNDVRFEFAREFKETVSESDAVTVIVLEAFNSGGAGTDSREAATRFKLSDNLMFDAGKHALKFGGEIEFLKLKARSANNTNGRFVFSSLANYAALRPSQFSQIVGATEIELGQTRMSVYAQDYFKFGKSLQIGAGLRYERQTGLRDDDNFSPRVGFVFSPEKSGKFIVRGGFGVFYDWFDAATAAAVLSNDARDGRNLIIVDPGFPDPFAGGTIARTLAPSVSRLADDLTNPRTFAAQTAFNYKLNKTVNFEGIYNFKRGTHHFRSRDTNAPVGGIRPDPNFGRIQLLESSGATLENSFELRTNVYYKGVNIYGNYQLAKQTADFADFFTLPVDNYNLRLDRGLSNLDQRHKLNLSLNFDVWKNIKVSPPFKLESGFPYTITTGRDDNGDTVFNDRPFGTGRNTERGAWLKQVDVRAQWKLPMKYFGGGEKSAKRSINLTANVRNLFNTTNLANYVGVQTSPFFGQATIARTARSLDLGASFNF